MAVIAFDIDGVIYKHNGKRNWRVINVLKGLAGLGNTIIVWSGGGADRAKRVVEKEGLAKYVSIATSKSDSLLKDAVDICFDDEWVKLAKVNIKLPEELPKSEEIDEKNNHNTTCSTQVDRKDGSQPPENN
jgi:hypothetical protein